MSPEEPEAHVPDGAPPGQAALLAAAEATWPPAATRRLGPLLLREGAGGGQRVSATTLEAPAFAEADIASAEAAMDALGQPRLFQLRPDLGPAEARLDESLARRGYAVVDPVTIWLAPIEALAEPSKRPAVGTTFATWPPLALQREIWAEEGIGPARLAVMARAQGPRAALLTRTGDDPAGVGFAAVAGGIAMVHALAVRPDQRRKGAARALMHEAAFWAQAKGARWLAVLVTRANAPANALYASLGMTPAGRYHYRKQAPERPRP